MPRIVLVWMGVALAITLILLILLVGSGHADRLDILLRHLLLDLDPPIANRAWRFVTLLGSGLVITIFSGLCLFVIAARAKWRAGTHLIFVMAGAVIAENALKYIVHRERPHEIFAYTMPPTYSFPSGHALFAFAFYVSVAFIVTPYMNQRARVALWTVTILLVILIGFSRIFLGVHYLTDVLGGYIAAALWLLIVHLAYLSGKRGNARSR